MERMAQSLTKSVESHVPTDNVDEMYQRMSTVLETLMTREDDSGHLLSEMFQELPDKDEWPDYYEEIRNPIALDIIKRKIDERLYRSEAEFEADVMLMVANAMEYNQEGSQVYEDAAAMQELFNELVRKKKPSDGREEVASPNQSLIHNGQTYEPGDFVYIFNPNDPTKPTVAQIITIWVRSTPIKREGITACWFLRPEQTVHRANTKFMRNEVFKTNHTENYYAEEIMGRCWVLFIKDYVRGFPKGVNSQDVFVCESRYNEPAKQYSKIKNWSTCVPEAARNKRLELELHPTPLNPPRIYPAFPPGETGNQSKPRNGNANDVQNGADRPASPKKVSSNLATPAAWSTPGVPSQPASSVFGTPLPSYGTPMSSFAGGMNGVAGLNSFFNTPSISGTQGYQSIPPITVDSFDTTEDGKLKWYAAPPLDVIDTSTTVHSLEYLYKKAQEKAKRGSSSGETPGSSKRQKRMRGVEVRTVTVSDSAVREVSTAVTNGSNNTNAVDEKPSKTSLVHVLGVLAEAWKMEASELHVRRQ